MTHYGWYIVLAGTFCVFACLGLARFALGMILPGMGQGLGLSYSQMGLIGTMNFAGYLAAVLFCGALAERLGYRLLISLALSLSGLTMVLIGFSSSLPVILLLLSVCLFGLVTFIFAIGQIAGPAIAEVMAEKTGSFLMAGLCTILGLLLALRLKPARP
ncbi:YbfB/YjiJ family MFS transporter [Desulfurivibrio dismutans]|uniref:YbfB/YjiJ family MFS transporter n=1 Tax=Desulfurivibrio dismutans TaxID=1398908 RepID=UPI0023DA1029|nr:YbfB/YjiJ family MFS transporter [Desulfurivibrio alkaliphilus]MDF1614122.1 YbfB/YjiJ family MFS transporter [Desulfurivibrio alkaliphilus]